MEVNGALVDGVIVEKDVARVTFNEEVREKKEVAFVEAVVGNVFKTKVVKCKSFSNSAGFSHSSSQSEEIETQVLSRTTSP